MGTGLQLVAERIDVSMDVPGGTQAFNLDQNTSKFQINNTAAPISGGADSKIILESRNSYLGGYRWTHDTPYQATPTSPGTYTLYQFLNDDQTGVSIFSFDSSGNVTIANDLTINGEIIGPTISVPPIVVVEGASQTFQYDGNHTSKFILKNTYAATSGNPSYIYLDFTNSTTGGYRFIHTSQSTDPSGLGTFKLQIYNSSGVTNDIYNVSIDGGGNPVFDLYGSLNSHGSTAFNIGGVGTCVFYVRPTIPDPVASSDAATKGYVDSVSGNLNNPLSLADTLTFNWSYAAPSNPAAYQFVNTFSDSQQDKKYRYRVLTNNISAGREWSIDYTLIGNSDLNGVYEIKYGASPLSTLTPFKIEAYPFATTIVTINGQLILSSNRITQVSDPISAQDAATKNYVDTSISAHTISLTGAVTGSGTSSIATTLNSTVNMSGATENFIFAGNHTATFNFENTFAAAVGSPSFMMVNLINSTTGGWRFLHTSSTTDSAGLGTLKIQALNNSAVTADNMVFSVNSGTGTPDAAFSGTATFNGAVTFNSTFVASVNVATYDFNLNNTNSSGITEYVISQTVPVLKLGYNASTALAYINSVSQPFEIQFNGTSYIHFSTSGYQGIGTTNPTQAKLVISGGVANVTSEDSCLRVTGSSNATKIEISNTSASGKLFELRSDNAGTFAIYDRTATTSRFSIDTSGNSFIAGNLAIGGASANAPLQFPSSTASRKIVLYETANNDHQVFALGVNSGIFRSQVDASTSDFVWYSGFSSSSSVELMRLKGTGILLFTTAGTGALIKINNTNASSTASELQFQNNGSQAFSVGHNNSTGESYVFSYGTVALKFGVGGTEYARINNSGYLGIGLTSITQAKLVISGGVANVTSEDSCLRVMGSSNATKIEINNTAASGKLFELRSDNAGSFVIYDRTATASRFTIDTNGNVQTAPHVGIGVAPNTSVQLLCSSTLSNRTIVLWQTGNNDHQNYSLGVQAGTFRLQVDATASNFIFYAATSSSASNELMRIQGNGEVGIGTPSPDTLLSVNGSADKVGGGSWGSFSDIRIKNVRGDYKHGLKEILQINPKVYQYTEESNYKAEDLEKDRIGIIAQEIEDILPECIELMDSRGFSDLRYYDSSPILYTLINAVKELNQKVEHLESTIH